MLRMEPPTVIPAGWRIVPDAPMIGRIFPSGMYATHSVETYTTAEDDPPLGIPGRYLRIVISRPDRYPGWDEMRDLVATCGLFDRSRDIFMLVPPVGQYVNVHNNAFHWWQRAEDVR